MSDHLVGWDIGGAHIKAAEINANGDVVQVLQLPCPLWKGMHELENSIAAISSRLTGQIHAHAVTMTGELVDLFTGRDEGVAAILATLQTSLASDHLHIYAGRFGFIPIQSLQQDMYRHIASANWLASATFAAQQIQEGLFVDIGSTTTDILCIQNARVATNSYSDYERLCSGELVYTGIVRTPVMAISNSVLFEGREVGLMAEYFATMADVYRLTGELQEDHDQGDSADGGAKTTAGSAIRLSRMIGCDYIPQQLPRWQTLAYSLRAKQLQKIITACHKVADNNNLKKIPIVVAAGIGRFLLKEPLAKADITYQDYNGFFSMRDCSSTMSMADCAPAIAVVSLLRSEI